MGLVPIKVIGAAKKAINYSFKTVNNNVMFILSNYEKAYIRKILTKSNINVKHYLLNSSTVGIWFIPGFIGCKKQGLLLHYYRQIITDFFFPIKLISQSLPCNNNSLHLQFSRIISKRICGCLTWLFWAILNPLRLIEWAEIHKLYKYI